MVQRLTTDT